MFIKSAEKQDIVQPQEGAGKPPANNALLWEKGCRQFMNTNLPNSIKMMNGQPPGVEKEILHLALVERDIPVEEEQRNYLETLSPDRLTNP